MRISPINTHALRMPKRSSSIAPCLLFAEERDELGSRFLGCEVELYLLMTFGVLLSP